MEYFQQLQTYFQGLGHSPQAAQYYSQLAYLQMMQQAQQAQNPRDNQQEMIRQFMSLNDGQKMQFAQNWLLKNPQFFKRETPETPKPAPTPKPVATETEDETDDKKTEDKKKETEKPKFPVISGTGTIDGADFKSGDGEKYTVKVASGSAYNLLSDKGLGINGKYGTKADSTDLILKEAAISFGGSIITIDDSGELKIDKKDFKSDKNDLDGAIEKKGSRYIIKAGDYEITVSATASSGVKFSITGTDIKKDGVAPEGLWGVTFDGTEDTKREIASKVVPKDYKIASVRKFDFTNNNNIDGGDTTGTTDTKKKTTKTTEEEYLSLWQDANPTLATVLGKIGGGTFQYFGLDMADTKDDSSWNMTKLNSSSIYNVFSDSEIQVGAKFNKTTGGLNYPREFGFYVNDKVIKVNRNNTTDGKLSVSVDGTTLGAGSTSAKATLSADQNSLTVESTVDGETWKFTVRADMANAEGLEMDISGTGVGKNDVRTSGLWGAFIGSGFVGDAGTNDNNGAGFIRASSGLRTWFDEGDMDEALESYELSEYETVDEGYSVYSGY
jgi:hypothetical protein